MSNALYALRVEGSTDGLGLVHFPRADVMPRFGTLLIKLNFKLTVVVSLVNW